MCGIAGLYLRDSACDPATLDRMRDILRHRGPDDAGSFIQGPVGLGHRRLSIIDLGTGHQPMSSSDGRYTIIFNGEIYNYRELRRELEGRGAVFCTQSDTEVILQLHAMEGEAGVSRLNGIFAYALWDAKRGVLLLVRDRAGIKPLYYAQCPGGFVFSSEIKALFESGLVKPEVSPQCVSEYLQFRQVAGPQNLFAGVLALAPGHTLEVINGKAGAPRCYWRPARTFGSFEGSYSAAVDVLDESLSEAVRRQMIADVPLGTFCSGGIDSSLVTAIASRHASEPVNTYSIGFDEPGYDESSYARMAAEACGTRHHELRISEDRFSELLPRLVWHHDLPLNFANSVHIFALSELARREVKVVLTGEGADELFGGYPRYYAPRIAAMIDRFPGPLRRTGLAVLGTLQDHRVAKLVRSARASPADRLLFNSTGIEPELVKRLVRSSDAGPEWGFRRQLIAEIQDVSDDPVRAMAQVDFETYLVSILNRQDKMSMATSLEARVPFLDNAVIDLASSFPTAYLQSARHRKRVLKDVARRYLPGAIVDRRKSGFGVPLPLWLRRAGPMSTMLDDVVNDAAVADLLDADVLRACVEEHRQSQHDHSELLWGVLNLGIWRRAFGH